MTLATLKAEFESKHAAFKAIVAARFPGCEERHWLRAVEHEVTAPAGNRAPIGRRNADTSQDVALAADSGIRAAWDAYITALHAFYSLRDGPRGFLGGKGL